MNKFVTCYVPEFVAYWSSSVPNIAFIIAESQDDVCVATEVPTFLTITQVSSYLLSLL